MIVVVNTIIDALSGFYLVQGDLHYYRAWAAVSLSLTAVINIILLFLMWILFETMGRVERESDRVQRLTDTMFRKLP